jgi:hypothetical protein
MSLVTQVLVSNFTSTLIQNVHRMLLKKTNYISIIKFFLYIPHSRLIKQNAYTYASHILSSSASLGVQVRWRRLLNIVPGDGEQGSAQVQWHGTRVFWEGNLLDGEIYIYIVPKHIRSDSGFEPLLNKIRTQVDTKR